MRHESRDLQSALVPINYGEWGGGGGATKR